jgi:hypothetical protein
LLNALEEYVMSTENHENRGACLVEKTTFVLQLQTVNLNREPRRSHYHNGSQPVFCYLEVDDILCEKIRWHLAIIDEHKLNLASSPNSSPQWRFPPGRHHKPISTRNTYLCVSKNYVWFSIAKYDGFDDLETARVPIDVFQLGTEKTDCSETHKVDHWTAKKEFQRLLGLETELDKNSEYQCGLFDTTAAILKLNIPMEHIVGDHFSHLVDESATAINALEAAYEKLEHDIDATCMHICRAALGLRRGEGFAALDRESRLIKIQLDYVTIDTSLRCMHLYGPKYRKDGTVGKQQGFLHADLDPMLEIQP